MVSLKLNLPTSSGLQARETALLLSLSALLLWTKTKSNVNGKHTSLETWWCQCGANAICISEEFQRIKKRAECLLVLNLSNCHQPALGSHLSLLFYWFQVGHILFLPLFPKSNCMDIEARKGNIPFLVPEQKQPLESMKNHYNKSLNQSLHVWYTAH